MLIYVDESGDTGMKLGKGSSAYFIIVAIKFDNLEAANACDAAIGQLRKDLGWGERSEFHFNKWKNQYREEFLALVASHEFSYFGIVLDKQLLTGPESQSKEAFYRLAVTQAFSTTEPLLKNATVVVDKCGSRTFQQRLATYIKSQMNTGDGQKQIKKLKMARSHSNNLVQLADMVCGAVARSYKLKGKGCEKFRKIIRRRELDIQMWPKPSPAHEKPASYPLNQGHAHHPVTVR